jgi:hypothetical protein
VVLFVVLTAVGVGVPVMLMRLVKFTPLRGYYSYVFG